MDLFTIRSVWESPRGWGLDGSLSVPLGSSSGPGWLSFTPRSVPVALFRLWGAVRVSRRPGPQGRRWDPRRRRGRDSDVVDKSADLGSTRRDQG